MDEEEELKRALRKLPLWAIVAFAARCARRVSPLFGSQLAGWDAVELAIRVAEETASGLVVTVDRAVVDNAKAAAEGVRGEAYGIAAAAAKAVYASAYIANIVSLNEAAGVFDAAVHDATVVADGARAAAKAAGGPAVDIETAMSLDLKHLMALALGDPRTLGRKIDPTPTGPLGPLWPNGEPDWFVKAKAAAAAQVASDDPPDADKLTEPADGSELVVELDFPDDWSDEQVIAAVRELAVRANEYHHALGGRGLRIEELEILEDVAVPAGGPR